MSVEKSKQHIETFQRTNKATLEAFASDADGFDLADLLNTILDNHVPDNGMITDLLLNVYKSGKKAGKLELIEKLKGYVEYYE